MATDLSSILASQDVNVIYQAIADKLGISLGTLFILLAVIGIWSLVWKGFALWKAARKSHKIWFIIILVANTVGILEILYIFLFSEMKFGKNKKK